MKRLTEYALIVGLTLLTVMVIWGSPFPTKPASTLTSATDETGVGVGAVNDHPEVPVMKVQERDSALPSQKGNALPGKAQAQAQRKGSGGSARIGAGAGGYEIPNIPPPAIPQALADAVRVEEEVNSRIYASVNKSVVNITTTATVAGIFGDEVSNGTGSGFIIDRNGYIVTNFHVIEGAEVVQITLYDGSNYQGKLVGADAPTDLAVLRINAPQPKLTPVSLGDSGNLLVGQKVLAVGNPFGLERTLTTGIISSLNRSIKPRNGRQIKGVIQTDCAINPGNSGGPLLNMRGQVIGMNTAILSQVGQSSGISMAVPVNTIKRYLKPLIETGRVVRADLGVAKVMVTENGLLLLTLVEDGAAERAGLRPMRVTTERRGPYLVQRPDPSTADIITSIDGHDIRSVDDLYAAVEAHGPGEACKVTIQRDGELTDQLVILDQS